MAVQFQTENTRWRPRQIARIGLFAALLSVCSWISIPLPVPVTLQTMAVFLAVGLLGLRDGTVTVLLYLLLGAAGLPVFSGMRGGLGALLGPTGGYLVGFLAASVVSGGVIRRFGRGAGTMAAGFILGMVACYLFGTVWYVWQYTRGGETLSMWQGLCWCVFPFCLPDGGKILLAVWLVRRLYPIVFREAKA